MAKNSNLTKAKKAKVELLKECDVVVTNPPFSCYSDDTEVKRNHGWKLFRNVTKI